MVVWIEIFYGVHWDILDNVTTCVVVWIEILVYSFSIPAFVVTTCVVVWIEILPSASRIICLPCHHLRGGVD